MEITFVTNKRLTKKLHKKLEKAFGFDVTLDCNNDAVFEYFFGYSTEGLEEGEEDPLPYEEAVRFCGTLWREGIAEFAIEGNGGWAMGMIMGTDFTGFAMSHEEKMERVRIASIFWREADPTKLEQMLPNPL